MSKNDNYTIEQQKRIFLGNGEPGAVHPEIVLKISGLSEQILKLHEGADVYPAASFYAQVLNAAILAVEDLEMDEFQFLKFCMNQYRLYQEVKSDTPLKNVNEVGHA